MLAILAGLDLLLARDESPYAVEAHFCRHCSTARRSAGQAGQGRPLRDLVVLACTAYADRRRIR
jgi:hypothetical protein